MQPLYQINDIASNISHHRLVNDGDISYHRSDAARFHAFISPHPHATAQQCFAISDRLSHLQMFVVRSDIHAMVLTELFLGVRLTRKVNMPEFFAQFAIHDSPILDRSDEVVLSTTKMLADGSSIICDGGDFYS